MQLSYDNSPKAALEGQKFDIGFDSVLTMRAAEAVNFGMGLVKVAGEDLEARLPNASGDKLFGVALHQHKNLEGYKAKESMSVLTKGRVFVRVEQAVTSDDPVYCRHTANGAGKVPGQFRKDIDTDKAILVSNARYLRSAAAGELAVLELL